jgi:hypothetical protein
MEEKIKLLVIGTCDGAVEQTTYGKAHYKNRLEV